jgi:hypothetical protein
MYAEVVRPPLDPLADGGSIGHDSKMAIGFRPLFSLVSTASVALACSGSAFTQSRAGTGGADAGTGATSGGGSSSGGGQGTGGSNAGGKSGGNSGGAGGIASTGGVTGTGGGVGTGGVIGAGGTGTGGVIGTGGSMGGACPPTLPAGGASCAPDGLRCPYGQCCPSFATCHQGQWQVAIASCPQPVCPDNAPKNGDACPCMLDGKSCDFNRCDSGGGHGTSTCSGGVWTVKDVGCPRPNYCANYACPSSSMCMAVVHASSGSVSLSCVVRQCPDPTAPVCSCVGNACSTVLGQCSAGPTGTTVICDAP